MPNMKRLILLSLFGLLFGCATVQTDTVKGASFSSYKRAYVKQLPEDEFQIYQGIFWELNDMGLEVLGVPFQQPTEQDLIVDYTYEGGWDLARYLQSFQLRFLNAKSSQVIVASRYRSRGMWRGKRDGRLEDAFNDIRAKTGLPPTKQFTDSSR
jgi:hypothetical protein